jgi:hypothetical protein
MPRRCQELTTRTPVHASIQRLSHKEERQ